MSKMNDLYKEDLFFNHQPIYKHFQEDQFLGFFEWCIKLDDGSRFLYTPWLSDVVPVPDDIDNPDEYTFRKLFGRRLLVIMRENVISRAKLSELTGMSTMAIGRYINGTCTPSGYALRKFARALGCSTDDFFYDITI